MLKTNGPKKKEKPNQRKLYFRQEAVDSLLECATEEEVTFEKAMIVAKLDCQQCKLHDASHPKAQNCRDNPYCINRLGLEKFEKLITKEVQNRDDAKKDQKRRDLNDQPTGLINSGNFCYVNSFLQVWFNVIEFRQIVYDFRPSTDYIVPELPRMDVQKVMLALQDLFYTLQTTPFYETDKNSQLIKALRLNTEQQDAQEFTLMLFDALDRNLQLHPNGHGIRERIRKLYMGQTQTRIFCECGMVSNRVEPSTSIQLNIDGHSTLLDALDANFGVEKLDDYRCSQCLKQGFVSKASDYVELPPVVIIQLNRYKYTAKGRQKLKTLLAYPRAIPAKVFQRTDQNNPPPADTYELFAVTIHEGNNAECGHYYDLVKAPLNQKWYRYNDANVEALSKPPGTDKPTSARLNESSRKPKAKDKGEKAAPDQKACYGLLYRRKDRSLPIAHPKVPPDELVAESRKSLEELFEGQTKSKIEKSEKRLYDLQRRWEKRKIMVSKLETYDGKFTKPDEIAFLPTELIINIMNMEYEVAKGKKEKKDEAAAATGTSSEVEEPASAITECSMVEADSSSIVMETSSDEKLSDNDTAVASTMDIFEPPPVDVRMNVRTRAQNGISKSVFGHTRSPRKTNGLTPKPPLSTRVAALLDSHELPVCGHGKLAIETILFGDVKAVSRAPAIALLREYDFRTKIVYDNGRREYPTPEKDKEVFLFTAEDICMDCVKEMRREGIYNSRLDEDERMVKKILKEEKIRCSVRGIQPKPQDHFYVAKTALANFKKLALSERDFQLKQQMKQSGVLCFDSVTAQKLDTGFPTNMLKKRGRQKKSISEGNGHVPEKIAKIGEIGVVNKDMEMPENLLEGDDEPEVEGNNGEPMESENNNENNGNEVVENVEINNGEQELTRSSRSTTEVGDVTRPSSRSSPTSSAAAHVEFNNELRCGHNGINYNQFRHSVSPEEWTRLTYYFNENFAVRCSDEVCEVCRQQEEEAHNGSENMRILVREMRKRLTETLKKVDARQESRNAKREQLKYGICSVFVEKLKKLSSRASTSPPQFCQSCLFCSHGRPSRGFPDENTVRDAHVIGLTAEEWNTFVEEINNLENAGTPDLNREVPLPIMINDEGEIEELCVGCFEKHVRFKEEEKYMFENENVYVRMVNPNDEEDGMKTNGKTTRRRKNLLAFKLSSSSRLLDLKIALYDKCYQSPTDQLLYRYAGGDEFDASSNEKTLYELKVLPNNNDNPLILVCVQNGSNANSVSEDNSERAPERGFVDTALAH